MLELNITIEKKWKATTTMTMSLLSKLYPNILKFKAEDEEAIEYSNRLFSSLETSLSSKVVKVKVKVKVKNEKMKSKNKIKKDKTASFTPGQLKQLKEIGLI